MIIEYIQDQINRQLANELDSKLKEYLRGNLSKIGYQFHSDSAFFDFCKERIRLVSFPENPYRNELYLDFVDVENKGTLIGVYSTELNIYQDGDTIKMTIG